MPPGTTKYNVDWEGQDDGTNNEPISKWFSKANEYQARCNLCNCTFNIGNKGISSIKRHASQKNHKAKSAKEAAKVNVSRESTSISDLTVNLQHQLIIISPCHLQFQLTTVSMVSS